MDLKLCLSVTLDQKLAGLQGLVFKYLHVVFNLI